MNVPEAATISWLCRPAGPLTLMNHDVHLWCASVSTLTTHIAELRATMSGDEIEHAHHYRFEADRTRYCASRGLLRIMLARYLGTSASALRFRYGPQGKPFLCPEYHQNRLHFNVSHCDDLVLYGVSLVDNHLGIDIERSRAIPDLLDIAQRLFSAREIQELTSLAEEQRQDAFFSCWTRKEAYIKAVGKGLSHSLDSFEVSLLPGAPAQLRALSHRPGDIPMWTLHAFEPARGYIGALAIRAQLPMLACWQISSLTAF